MFQHCREDAEVWRTFHAVACLCHPAQGGYREDMEALCRAARESLTAEAWPWPDDKLPNLFDIWCVSQGVPNPFGGAGISATAATTGEPGCCVVEPYEPPSPFAAFCATGAGKLVLVFSAAAAM